MARNGATLLVIILIAAAILVWRFSRHAGESRAVVLDSSEGFADLAVPITSRRCDSRGGCSVNLSGSYKGRQIGLRIIFAPDMKENKFEALTGKGGGLFALPNGICFELKGEAGKNFVRLLSSIYRTPIVALTPTETICTTALPLEGDPGKIERSVLKFKIFHHDSDPDAPDYFELFIDPDLPRGIVRFNEKDVDYRKGVLRAFGATVD
ncbi:MAG: hypothetical protein WA476_02355 [Acidobacteriaceae bacterium]